MRIFEIVKENINLREAAELYGIDVNRYGKALCPFHNDRHPSLYVADDHYYCFACGEHGDVIDFVGRLFQLSPYDAARKLMTDFHLSPDKPPSAAALHAKRIRTEAQRLMENERLCFSVLSDYARVLRNWKVRYAPQSPDQPVHARFTEACRKLDETEYYLSCSRLYNDYDGIQHDYTKKRGLVWQEVFLPKCAPQEWQDREKLWNAVEEVETAKDSRLAREFVVALPIELNREEQIALLQEFIREQFVSDGMCADAAIHDTDGHNPHAHILLTVRPLDEQGKWQYKTEKEYLCMRNGEERGFTAAEFKAAQDEGWEKQYPYKVGKKKVYMVSSEADAQGLIRADKHPKSTRYGRQNPISERWNSEEQLAAWRAAWADVSNRYLERAGREERIDHRSNAARGLDEIPTIHEGVTAQALERKGIISDRCELNRQIRADNALLRELKAEIKKLAAMIARTVPTIAEGLEKLRSRVLIFCYQLSHIRSGKSHIQKSLAVWKPELECYTGLVQQIKEKSKERKALITEKKELPIYHVKRHKALAVRITELTEELEELRSEKALLLQKFEYAEDAGAEAFHKDIAAMEAGLKKLETQEQKYSAELDKALDEYAELKAQAADFDPVELYEARQAIRPAQEKAAEQQLEDALQKKPSFSLLLNAKQETSRLLKEDTEERQVRQMLIRRQRSDPQKPKHFQR
mgnify:CR=1 FL=1